MRLVKRIFWVVVLLVVVLFAVINMDNVVSVQLDPFKLGYESLETVKMSLPVIVLVSLLVGLFVGALFASSRERELRRGLKREQRRRDELDAELRRVQAAMKAADHPDSAGLPVKR